MVNIGLNRDNQPKPVEKRCHVCNTRLIEYPYKFDLHCFAAAMAGRFTWESSYVCPHAKAEWHDALKLRMLIAGDFPVFCQRYFSDP